MTSNQSQVPYDPLLEPPRSPRLPDSEFGAPSPHFFEAGTRASSAASMNAPSMGAGFRGSEYGSIAALRDSSYLPPGAATPYRDDPSTTGASNLDEKNELYAAPRTKSKRKALVWGLVGAGVALIIVAVAVPVALMVSKKSGGGSSTGSSSGGGGTNSGGSGSSNHPAQNIATTGGDGSVVTKDDGSTFIYNNTFGGFWVFDPANPLNQSAQAQSYTPPLTQQWNWGVNNIYGVNLGGWLVLEPFITPALYEPFYPNAVDEWTLSTLIQQRDGNLNAIEDHYKTFITEEDFAQIVAAGLNWVRIPFPFWAIEKYDAEPFLERTSWTYFLKAIEWARKYGLRINLDLHTIPGSQNGWNHSGKAGQINFMNGIMGMANAQRTLDYIRIIAEFISQPEYKDIVPFFGIMNEPVGTTWGINAMSDFYAEAYQIVRNAGGTGAGNGPFISIHEAFFGLSQWSSFLTGADRLALDSHPYLCFGTLSPDPVTSFPPQPCQWGSDFGSSMSSFGMTAAGEWSLAINDCGLYVNAVGEGTRYEGTFDGATRIGSCDTWNNYTTWDQTTKDSLKSLALSTMDALQNWFFWTWKIGASSASGQVEAPFWSYSLALANGFAPTDPRQSVGHCQSLGATGNTFTGSLQSWQVGGSGAGTIPTLNTYPWPPTSFDSTAVAGLPVYTATGTIVTLPAPTFTSASPSVTLGSGWNNASDTAKMAVPISGCTYPDPWNALTAAAPACAVGAAAKRDAGPGPTPAPL